MVDARSRSVVERRIAVRSLQAPDEEVSMSSVPRPDVSSRPLQMTSLALSMLACLLAAHSSIFSLGQPEATAFAIPPIDSHSSMIRRPSSYTYVRYYDITLAASLNKGPNGSRTHDQMYLPRLDLALGLQCSSIRL